MGLLPLIRHSIVVVVNRRGYGAQLRPTAHIFLRADDALAAALPCKSRRTSPCPCGSPRLRGGPPRRAPTRCRPAPTPTPTRPRPAGSSPRPPQTAGPTAGFAPSPRRRAQNRCRPSRGRRGCPETPPRHSPPRRFSHAGPSEKIRLRTASSVAGPDLSSLAIQFRGRSPAQQARLKPRLLTTLLR